MTILFVSFLVIYLLSCYWKGNFEFELLCQDIHFIMSYHLGELTYHLDGLSYHLDGLGCRIM